MTATKLNEIKLGLWRRKLFISPINKLMERMVSVPILSMCQDCLFLTKRDMTFRVFILTGVSLLLGQIVLRLVILLLVERNFEDKFSAELKNQDLETKRKQQLPNL